MKTNRKIMTTAACCAAALAIASPAQAAPSLQTFGTGTVTIINGTISIVNADGQYGGVYLKSKSTSGKKLTAIDFSFSHSGDVGGGAPRFSLPIDTDMDGSTDNGYAFIDVNSCGGAALVSTESPTCQVYFNDQPGPYDNWDAFAAAHPTWRSDPGSIPFIIADVPGNYVVSNVVLR